MECLGNIVQCYYQHMKDYMPSIFEITRKVLAEETDEAVPIKALEIWCNVCDAELDAAEQDDTEEPAPNFHFAEGVAPHLVPLLLAKMPAVGELEEQDDEDSSTLSAEAEACLTLLARAVGDPVLTIVMPFVQQHVASPAWRARQAAVNAFTAVVAGPNPDSMVEVLRGALPSLLNMMKDAALPVRRAASYAVFVCIDVMHACAEDGQQVLLTPDALQVVLAALLEAVTTADVSVAEYALLAIGKVAEGYWAVADEPQSPLSPYLHNVVQALLLAADRPDGGFRLRAGAHDALCDAINAATAADGALLSQPTGLVPHLLGKLAATMEATPTTADGLQAQAELQGTLCGVLMVITHRMQHLGEPHLAALKQYADAMMAGYLRVFTCRSAAVHAEALLAVSALADALGKDFGKYMEHFWPTLRLGLANFADYTACENAVHVVGDLARALEQGLAPYADDIMMALLTDLASNELAATVKPAIISAFGDVAMALGPAFTRFLNPVAPMLAGASQHAMTKAAAAAAADDDDGLEASNKLRAAIMEAYTGIMQGLREDAASVEAHAKPLVAPIMDFLAACCCDATAMEDDAVVMAAVGLVGDLAQLPGVAPLCASRREFQTLLERCFAEGTDPAIVDVAKVTKAHVQAGMQVR